MASVTELIALFTQLASHIETPSSRSTTIDESLSTAICSLTQLLNLDQGSRVRVLNAALSLMCFKAPEVYDSMVETLVGNILTVLSCSISCKVLQFHSQCRLQIGSLISTQDSMELIQVSIDLCGRLQGHGMLSQLLFHAVLRVAVSSSCYQSLFSVIPVLCLQPRGQRNTVVSELHSLFPERISIHDNHRIPVRVVVFGLTTHQSSCTRTADIMMLLNVNINSWRYNGSGRFSICLQRGKRTRRFRFVPVGDLFAAICRKGKHFVRLYLWYLDPLILKHDISQILREAMIRPFLSLEKELHDRLTWRSIIICLVLSPTMFIETRILLHNWFLVTGLQFILELQIQLVAAMLDVLFQPIKWGMPMELGSKLPFCDSYFPDKHDLVAKLVVPISCASFLDLLHVMTGAVCEAETIPVAAFKQSSLWVQTIDHKSNWVTLNAFPAWFLFAAMLLFCESNQNSFLLNRTSTTAVEMGQKKQNAGKYHVAALSYLACIMHPMNKAHFDLVIDCLSKMSESWILKQFGSDKKNQVSCLSKRADKINSRDGETVRLWLKEIENHQLNKILNCCCDCAEAKNHNIFESRQKLVFRRIPLGIFMGWSNVDEEGCELLLHYAATGTILDNVMREQQEFVSGACLVLNLFDDIEDMSSSLFETEERRLEFVCKLKTKSVMYLVKCIGKLIDQEESRTNLMDLQRRLMEWRCQGGQVIHCSNKLDHLLNALNCKIGRLI